MAMEAASRKAEALLEIVRQTAMRHGAVSKPQTRLKADIARSLAAQGTSPELARRVAFQLVFKADEADLADPAVWGELGQILQREAAVLKTRLGLSDRQATAALPKLSAGQIEAFLGELQVADRRIARTILNAALQAAEPLSTGRRYLAEYRGVAEQLQAIDPTVARTLANATFNAGAPRKKAMEHFAQFAELVMKFRDDVAFGRMLAKMAFRAADPIKAAETFIREYQSVIAALSSSGVEVHIARTLARSRRFRGAFGKVDAAMMTGSRG
jgi:hypothetical protein